MTLLPASVKAALPGIVLAVAVSHSIADDNQYSTEQQAQIFLESNGYDFLIHTLAQNLETGLEPDIAGYKKNFEPSDLDAVMSGVDAALEKLSPEKLISQINQAFDEKLDDSDKSLVTKFYTSELFADFRATEADVQKIEVKELGVIIDSIVSDTYPEDRGTNIQALVDNFDINHRRFVVGLAFNLAAERKMFQDATGRLKDFMSLRYQKSLSGVDSFIPDANRFSMQELAVQFALMSDEKLEQFASQTSDPAFLKIASVVNQVLEQSVSEAAELYAEPLTGVFQQVSDDRE